MIRTQSVAQGAATDDLVDAAQGQASIESVVQNNTGGALTSQIESTSDRQVVPVTVVISDATVVEGDTGQSQLEFTVTPPQHPRRHRQP